MECYPKVLIQQLVPHITFEVSEALEGTPVADCFVKNISQFNINGKVWDNSIIKNRLSNVRYSVEVVQESQQSLDLPQKSTNQDEHSILSPFNIDSDLFPNGILSRKWFAKYTHDLPFAFIKTMLLPQDASQDPHLIKQINEFKVHFNTHNVKFVVILVSQSEGADTDQRVDYLRNMTSLPRLTGLLHLHDTEGTLNRDSELVITTLFSNLRSVAVDFYSNIEHKIKQRNNKYYTCPSTQGIESEIEITPRALETRNLIKQAMVNQLANPSNLEQALKVLELSYQNLVELLRDDFGDKIPTLKTISEHDRNLYYQYRQLCDIIAFHIVRGYFSLEDPITALKKHKTHIANIFSVVWGDEHDNLKSYNNSWAAKQYEWLAQLMQLVPSAVLKDLQLSSKKASKGKSLAYYGGLKILGNYSFDIITTPTLAYLRSVYYMKKIQQVEQSQYAYLFENPSAESIKNTIIDLLEKSVNATASSALATSDDHIESLTFISYINWLVGEEYYSFNEEHSYKKAIEFYETALANSAIEKWAGVSSMIIQKLILSYSKLKDSENELINILKLAKVSQDGHMTSLIKNEKILDNDDIKETHLDDSIAHLGNWVDYHALLSSHDNKEAYMFDKCQAQVLLKNNLDMDVVVQFLPTGSKIQLVVEQLEISIARLDGKQASRRSIAIKNDQSINPSFFSRIDLESSENHQYFGSVNLEQINKTGISRVLRFDQIFQKTGLYEIQSIKSKLRLVIRKGEKEFALTKEETLDLEQNPFSMSTHHNILYTPVPGRDAKKLDELARKWYRITTPNSRIIKVSPLRPNLTATLDGAIPANIFLGEKVAIPVTIKYQSPRNELIKYRKLAVLSSAKVSWEKNDLDIDVTTQVSWDDLKDDEALGLHDSVTSAQHEKVHTLNISLLSPPNADFQSASAKLVIDFKTIVSEETGGVEDEDDEESIYETNTYEIPILSQPFRNSCLICPRCRTDGQDMPSPFVIGGDLGEAARMPIAQRLWSVEFSMKTLEQSEIEIVDAEISVKAKNPEVLVQTVGKSELTPHKARQLVTTRSKTGFTHRNAAVTAAMAVKWSRRGSELVNTYTTDEVEIVLPLSDPRVLVSVKSDGGGRAKLQYVLENPTSRIFSFTTQLDEEDGWSFDDERNPLPLRQPSFPVLPFSQHIMEYHGSYESAQWVVVPNLRVYDVQYKVGLPPLSVSESVVMRENRLVWKAA